MKVIIEFNNTREGFDKTELYKNVTSITKIDDEIQLCNSSDNYIECVELDEIETIIIKREVKDNEGNNLF